MRIVDRKTFLALPANTVYSKYAPCYMEALEIKGDTNGSNDFYTQQIADAVDAKDSVEFGEILNDAQENGTVFRVNLNSEGRDGCFDDDQLFCVWDTSDVEALIRRLQMCLMARLNRSEA